MLHRLLTNVTYVGKLKYKDEVHDGEHDGIVDPEVWQRVQTLLARHGRTGGAEVRNKFGALLKGIIHCSACNCAMSPSHSTKKRSDATATTSAPRHRSSDGTPVRRKASQPRRSNSSLSCSRKVADWFGSEAGKADSCIKLESVCAAC